MIIDCRLRPPYKSFTNLHIYQPTVCNKTLPRMIDAWDTPSANEHSMELFIKDVYKRQSIIVAASTNNQAVTNILDDFARIPADEGLYCRWIPWMRSFGSYFPANNKKEAAEQQGRQTDIFFEKCRAPESIRQAEEEMLRRAKEFAGRPLPLAEIPAFLKQELTARYRRLTDIERTYARLAAFHAALGDVAALPDADLQTLRDGAERFLERWKSTLQERSLWEKLLFFLPNVKKRVEESNPAGSLSEMYGGQEVVFLIV